VVLYAARAALLNGIKLPVIDFWQIYFLGACANSSHPDQPTKSNGQTFGPIPSPESNWPNQ
jgi:hypothetical protein